MYAQGTFGMTGMNATNGADRDVFMKMGENLEKMQERLEKMEKRLELQGDKTLQSMTRNMEYLVDSASRAAESSKKRSTCACVIA
jgi:hypothetical protein